MIEVHHTKHDPFLGKPNTKITVVATEEKALAKAAAIATVNKLPEGSIKEKRDAAGHLVQVVISEVAPEQVAAPVVSICAVRADGELPPDTVRDNELEQLKYRIERLEEFVGLNNK